MITMDNNKELNTLYRSIQKEILLIGWKGILEMYHPDQNINAIEPHKLFQLYKKVYTEMQLLKGD